MKTGLRRLIFTHSGLAFLGLFLGACSTEPSSDVFPAPFPTIAALKWEEVADAPKAKVEVPPVYPFELWRDRKPGVARVIFRTDSRGQVTDLRCVDATDEVFAAATMRALAKWQFPQKSAGPFRLSCRYFFDATGARVDWK